MYLNCITTYLDFQQIFHETRQVLNSQKEIGKDNANNWKRSYSTQMSQQCCENSYISTHVYPAALPVSMFQCNVLFSLWRLRADCQMRVFQATHCQHQLNLTTSGVSYRGGDTPNYSPRKSPSPSPEKKIPLSKNIAKNIAK